MKKKERNLERELEVLKCKLALEQEKNKPKEMRQTRFKIKKVVELIRWAMVLFL